MQQEFFRERIEDCDSLCEKNSCMKFLGFLSLEETAFAKTVLARKTGRYVFFGGYPDAQRVVLGFFPEWAKGDEFPIVPITCRFPASFSLSHRDFLGSLMALGLKRETVGDILMEPGRGVIFVLQENAPYILSQLTKIGRVGIKAEIGCEMPLPTPSEKIISTVTVASERLDCVVSALCGCSRSQAQEKIKSGLVSVNSLVCDKDTKALSPEDVFSVKGKGKFKILSFEGKTKKDRWILKYESYQ